MSPPVDEVVTFDGGTAESLARALAGPGRVFLDTGCTDAGAGAVFVAADLVVTVSTAAAAHLDLAPMFVEAVLDRFPDAAPCRKAMHSAVQEAVANGVVHGNLALDGSLRCSTTGIALFAVAMANGIADPRRARLPLVLAASATGVNGLCIEVLDVGAGFDWERCRASAGTDSHCGRGLAEIARCCQGVASRDGGRRLAMTFAW